MIEMMMMLMMKLLQDRKKTSLAKQKGDITENQQIITKCDWLDYWKQKVIGSKARAKLGRQPCHT